MKYVDQVKKINRLFSTGDFQEALFLLTSLSTAKRNKPDVAMRIADCHYELGDYKSAVRRYTHVIQSDTAEKGVRIAFYNRGLSFRELDDFKSALNDFIAAGEDWGKGESFIGEMHSLLGNHVAACKYLENWTQKHPDDSYSLYCLGKCYNQLDMHQKSFDTFKQCFALGDKSRLVLNGLITEMDWLDKIRELREFMNTELNDEVDTDGSLRDKCKEILDNFGSK